MGKELGYSVSDEGTAIFVENRPGDIEVSFEHGKGFIKYEKKIHFFRALGLFFEAIKQKDTFCIVEEPQFTMNGAMIDASRNAVPTVNSL